MAFQYTAPDGSVLTVEVGVFGKHDVHVKLRSLDRKFSIDQVLAMIYPTVDQLEIVMAGAQVKPGGSNA